MPAFSDVTIEALFGADDAENERPERLKEYFYVNGAYESLRSKLPLRILVGHKGVGKSAILKRAHLDDLDSQTPSFWLRPNDIVDIKRVALEEGDFIRRIEVWKSGLLTIALRDLAVKTYGEQASSILPSFSDVGPSQLLKLFPRMISEFIKHNGSTRSEDAFNVYIDDIDRGWSASPADIKNISALLNALRDIGGIEEKIRFRIGLRSDVYFLVRTSDESTDKVERNVIWLKWTNDEILRLFAKRIETYFGVTGSDQTHIARLSQGTISESILSKVVEPKFSGYGHWDKRPIHNVLLSLTRARPRDLVKLFHASAKKAYVKGSEIIMSSHLKESFEPYSQERLQDIINEFRTELPQIEHLLLRMKPTTKERRTAQSYTFTTDALSARLSNIRRNTALSFSNGKPVTTKSLIQFMYKIDFITARKTLDNGQIDRHYFDESRFLANEIVDFGYQWEIHPAYRWALQPQDIQDVIDSLSR